MKTGKKGINAQAWFTSQSFHDYRFDLEREAERLTEQHQGSVEDVFANFDPETGKRIRPDQEGEEL